MNLYNQPVYNQGGFPGMIGGAGMPMGMMPMNPMMMGSMMNPSGINPMLASGMNPMMVNPMMAASGINPMMASGMNPMMNMNMMGMMQGSFGYNNNLAAQQQQMMMSMMNNNNNNVNAKMGMGDFGDIGLMNSLPMDNSKINDPNAKKPFEELDEMFAVKSKNNPGASANLI